MPEILKEIYRATSNENYIKIRLSDKSVIECKVDCLTYVNKSDEEDTDVPVALVFMKNGHRRYLSEDEILEIIGKVK